MVPYQPLWLIIMVLTWLISMEICSVAQVYMLPWVLLVQHKGNALGKASNLFPGSLSMKDGDWTKIDKIGGSHYHKDCQAGEGGSLDISRPSIFPTVNW